MDGAQKELVNKIANSGIITLDLAEYLPQTNLLEFDLKDYLVQGIALMEKPYRTALAEINWEQYKETDVAVHCSADAIIPLWAYMLAATYLEPVAKNVYYGKPAEVYERMAAENIRKNLLPSVYEGQRVVLKGCGDKPVPASAYMEATLILKPVVRSLMYGEPCSTVPVYKQKPKP